MGRYKVTRDKADKREQEQHFEPKTPPEVLARNREYYRKNAEKLRAYSRKYYQENKEFVKSREKARGAIYRERSRHIVRATHARQWRELRKRTLETLGGEACIKCGFSDYRALQVDHINGGGAKHMKQFTSNKTYLRYVRENPSEFQVLCANCNFIKRYENNELPLGKRVKYES